MYLKTYSIEHMAVAECKPPLVGGLQLRPYQVEGRDWLLSKKRAFLTDKAGLGKTLQAAEAAERPVLIVAPTYLTKQWYDFIRSQYPTDSVTIATGALHRFDRQARLHRKRDWYIVNHQMMRPGEFKFPHIKTVIVDESHHFRNRNALQSIGLSKLCSDMDLRIYMLTASPMWKNTDDLWMQLHIIQPEIFSSYNDFVDYFMIVDDTQWGPKVLGIKRQTRRELEQMLSILMLGRDYKDVGRYLPSSIKNEIRVNFPPDLKKSYDELRRKYRLEIEESETLIFGYYIEVLHVLRALTNFAGKQDALIDRLEDVGKPALIYVYYKEVARELSKRIAKKTDRKVHCLTGDVSPAERLATANMAARKGDTIVATQHSMSEGTNLQAYRHVIFYESDWAPGRNYQAMSRAVRDRNDNGSDREPVLVDYIMVAGSADEVIYGASNQREVSITEVMKAILV